MKRLTTACFALAVLPLLWACGDGETKTEFAPFVPIADTMIVTADTTTTQPDTIPFPETTPAGPSTLTCTQGCVVGGQAGMEFELSVSYRDSAGGAHKDKAINWTIDALPDVGKLSALQSYTNDNGIATVTLRTFGLAGAFNVSAKASGDADAGNPVFAVTLTVPPSPILQVSADYIGDQGIAEFQLRLFRQESGLPNCGTAHPDAGGVHPEPNLVLGPFGFGQQASVFELDGLEDGESEQWMLQFIGPTAVAPLAVGCVDGITISNDTTTRELVFVLDLPNLFRGTYGVTTRADLVTGLSGTAGSIIGGLTELFTAPGALIITWACKNASGGLGTVCNFLTDDSGNLTIVGGFIADTADAGLLALMSSQLGPGVTANGTLISEILRDLRLLSRMEVSAEPGANKAGFEGVWFPSNSITEVWTHVRFKWKFDPACKNGPSIEDCGFTSIPMPEIYGVNPTETIEAGVDKDRKLHIDNHEVSQMTYGPMVNAIVETKLLQLLFGDGSNGLPPVDSYDDLISVLLGDESCLFYDDCCDFFTQRVEDQVPIWVAVFIPAACEAAIPAAANLLRNQVLSLDGAMSFGTPADGGCTGIDGNQDRWMDGFGTSAVPCGWDVSVPIGGSNFRPDSDWRSVLQ